MAAILSRLQCVRYNRCLHRLGVNIQAFICISNFGMGFRRSERSQVAKFLGPTWDPLGPVGPRWAPCWPHEPCYQEYFKAPSELFTLMTSSALKEWDRAAKPCHCVFVAMLLLCPQVTAFFSCLQLFNQERRYYRFFFFHSYIC